MNLNDSWWEMGNWEFATKSESPRCDGKLRDGMYARSIPVRLTWFIIVCVHVWHLV